MLLRDGLREPEVLMGRRHSAHSFLPGLYVFPGGQLEPLDRHGSGFEERLKAPPSGLDLATRRQLACLTRAAIRETFEETGLLVGEPGPRAIAHEVPQFAAPVWRAFAAAELAPAFQALTLVARAITPSSSPKRFHTRFFLVDGAKARGTLRSDGELEDLAWIPVSAVPKLPIPAQVTALVLAEALARREAMTGRAADRGPASAAPAALFCWAGRERRPRHRPGLPRARLD